MTVETALRTLRLLPSGLDFVLEAPCASWRECVSLRRRSPLAVILPSLVCPFGINLMRIYAQEAVLSTLIEAARIDGAGEFRIFRTIAFRLLAPAS